MILLGCHEARKAYPFITQASPSYTPAAMTSEATRRPIFLDPHSFYHFGGRSIKGTSRTPFCSTRCIFYRTKKVKLFQREPLVHWFANTPYCLIQKVCMESHICNTIRRSGVPFLHARGLYSLTPMTTSPISLIFL